MGLTGAYVSLLNREWIGGCGWLGLKKRVPLRHLGWL